VPASVLLLYALRDINSDLKKKKKKKKLKIFMHSSSKRAETTALVDSGATENFFNLSYARYLGLPIK
jgi:hypothetical protein